MARRRRTPRPSRIGTSNHPRTCGISSRAVVTTQQLVILARGESIGDSLLPLGSRDEIIRQAAIYNTAPETDGRDILFGPGIRIELPPGEPVRQMLMTVTEEEIAWQVIMRLAKDLQWKLLDPATGRELSP